MSKTAFINAKVYVEKGEFASAVLQEDGIIKLVGSKDEILAAAGDAEVIDCGGKTIIPGLNDSHMHLLQLGMSMMQVDMSKCRSAEDMVETGIQYLKDHPGCRGLITQSWNDDLFDEDKKRLPNRHDCDRISTEIPVVLTRICNHSCAVNTLVLNMMGLDENNHYIEGGDVALEESGFPSGYLYESAQSAAKLMIPKYNVEELKEFYKLGMGYAVSHGMTTVQSNDYYHIAPIEDVVQALDELYKEGGAPMRYVSQNRCDNLDQMIQYRETMFGKKFADGWLEYGPVKIFKDGSLGARSSLMRKPYADAPDIIGVEAISDEMQASMMKYAAENGIQVVTHAIGDEAIDRTQRIYAEYSPEGNPLRHSVIHYQISHPEQLEFTKKHNFLIGYQPIFLEYDLHIVEDRVGKEAAKTTYMFKTAYEMGIHTSLGTDCPVEDCNPLLNIYTAVTRKDLKGWPEGGWNPEECLTVEDAIDMYTVESAYAEFKEDVKGRIKPGFFADMVVLDKDIFTCDPMEIKDILPEITMVGGKIVYRK